MVGKLLDNYKKSYPDKAAMGKLVFEVIKLEINGDAAYMLGKWFELDPEIFKTTLENFKNKILNLKE